MTNQNELYPIFLKLHKIHVLIVGGGKVAFEKLHFMLKSSPNTAITLMAPEFSEEVLKVVRTHSVYLLKQKYSSKALKNKTLVIAATNKTEVNKQIHLDARKQNVLVNVADTPQLCDFYLGSIVTKGHLKLAISTNGKSPVLAKRLRQFFEQVFPDDISDLLENMNKYRVLLKGTLQHRTKTLNTLTKSLIN